MLVTLARMNTQVDADLPPVAVAVERERLATSAKEANALGEVAVAAEDPLLTAAVDFQDVDARGHRRA